MPIPPELEEPPDEPNFDPPVEPAARALPIAEMAWEDFEKLVLELAKREGGVEHAQRFGRAGQNQSGIDIYARREEAQYVVYQCRRVAKLTAGDLAKAVDRFLEGEWAAKSGEFVFATTFSTVERNLALAVEAQAERLREAGLVFTIWDSEVLSARLRVHPGLVEQFFGSNWLTAFLPGVGAVNLDARLGNIEQAISQFDGVEILIFDWDPEQARKELKELKDADPELFRRLEERIGNPPGEERVANLITERPDWLAGAGIRPWQILAQLAEQAGSWVPATDAWSEAADRASGDERAGLLVAAAVTASVAGDTASHDAFLDDARMLAPQHPRVRLQDLDQSLGGKERLEHLEGLKSDDPAVAALIAGHRALAHLLLGEVESAHEFQREAARHRPKAAIVRMIAINVTVQQAREDTLEHRRLDYPSLTRAYEEALELREALQRQQRYQESVRVLMLAADVQSMIGEAGRAAALLRSATPEERAVPDFGEVVGDAAIRAGAWRDVLDLTDGATSNDMIERIRATALLQIGTFPQRSAAIKTLDQLVAGRGDEAPLAAITRLALVMGKRAPWSEEAEGVLRERGLERAAVFAKAFALQEVERDPGGAAEILAPHEQTWALLGRLRLARMRRDWGEVKEMASVMIDRSPAQDVVIECAGALAMAGELQRAETLLAAVARDETCPPAWRADAYEQFVSLLVDAGELEAAREAHEAWTAIRPQDTRAQELAPVIASRIRAQRGRN